MTAYLVFAGVDRECSKVEDVAEEGLLISSLGSSYQMRRSSMCLGMTMELKPYTRYGVHVYIGISYS